MNWQHIGIVVHSDDLDLPLLACLLERQRCSLAGIPVGAADAYYVGMSLDRLGIRRRRVGRISLVVHDISDLYVGVRHDLKK
jgi:hypothetical protein